jgi:hypothetical protein
MQKTSYEAPKLSVLGSVAALTEGGQESGSDGKGSAFPPKT